MPWIKSVISDDRFTGIKSALHWRYCSYSDFIFLIDKYSAKLTNQTCHDQDDGSYRYILGGLNAIATLELFTQNYLFWSHTSFTIWKRIKFYVYPPGARLSRPPHLFTQRLFFFENFFEIPGPIRVRSTNFFAKKFVDRTRIGPGISKKISNTFIHIWVTGTHL